MADVVLDEWVLIRGLDAEHPDAGFERESADLLAIVQTSHRWVMTDDVVDAYERRIYRARYKGGVWKRLMDSFLDTLINADCLWIRTVPTIDGAYDQDDVAWVSAAATAPAGCLLVTGDRRLLKQPASTDLPKRHAFRPCFVGDALVHLDPGLPGTP